VGNVVLTLATCRSSGFGQPARGPRARRRTTANGLSSLLSYYWIRSCRAWPSWYSGLVANLGGDVRPNLITTRRK